MTRSLLRLIRKRHRILKIFQRNPTAENRALLQDLCTHIKKAVRLAKSDYFNNHLAEELSAGNSKPLFNLIRSTRGHSNNISKIEGCSFDDIPEKLAEFMSSVYTSGPHPTPSFLPPNFNVYLPDLKVDFNGVQKLLHTLDARKSTGPVGITGKTLKSLSLNVPSFITCIVAVF